MMLKAIMIYIFISHSSAFANSFTLRGSYNYSYWGFDIYEASLFMDKKCKYPECDFSLQLRYDKEFNGTDIVKQSIEEIHAMYALEAESKDKYTKILNKIFPNVVTGDTIQGKMIGGYAEFYLNNKFIGKINDKTLSKYFFDIWLSPKTSEPTMRQKLLSEKQ